MIYHRNGEVIAFNPGSCQGRPWKLPGLALEAARAGPGRSQGQPWKLLGLALGFPTCSGCEAGQENLFGRFCGPACTRSVRLENLQEFCYLKQKINM